MPAAAVPLEIEAKLAVNDEREMRVIAALGRVGPFELRPRGRARLHSLYFDTEELVLARHGISLRARRDGRHWEMTLKREGSVRGALHSRPELTVPLTRPPDLGAIALPPEFHREVCALVAGRPLRNVLVTDVRRDLHDIVTAGARPKAEPLAELACDKVVLRAPADSATSATYCEIEIEQKKGTANDVAQIARLLQHQFELSPSADTKFSHGVNLLYGPHLAEYELPLADGGLGRAAQRLIGRNLARMRLCDPGTRAGDDLEHLHDMRVALRRLRALLRFFDEALPAQRAKHLRAELRWLDRLLSPVRDCDVQLATMERHEMEVGAAHRAALQPYRDYIRRERDQHRNAMLTALDSKRYFTLLLKLEQFAHDRRPVRQATALAPAAEVGRDAVKRAFRHLVREGKSAAAKPSPEQLHQVRIRARRLRYLLEFLRESTGKPGRRLLADLIELQDQLGTHNDAMVAASLLDRYVNGPGADSKAATLLTLGGFLQEEVRRARKSRNKFHRSWKRFAGKRTEKESRDVQRMLAREADVVAARNAGGDSNQTGRSR